MAAFQENCQLDRVVRATLQFAISVQDLRILALAITAAARRLAARVLEGINSARSTLTKPMNYGGTCG